jgi:ribulose 1,5-bisphosphate carboxylase large subunit-like protein
MMGSDKVIVQYRLSFQKETVDRSVQLLLAEMTSGIQYVSTRSGVQMDRVQDSVPFVDTSVNGEVQSLEQIDEDEYRVCYSLPAENLDPSLGGLTNLWPVVAGEVFNFHFIASACLEKLVLPEIYEKRYRGPGFGVGGVREIVGVATGPLFGSIIKPNVGLDPERSAGVVRILSEAGFNFIKDDEICVSPSLCPLKERVERIGSVLRTHCEHTGSTVLYAANVTSDFSVLGKAAEIALNAGAGALMIDPFCTGISALDYLRRNFEAPIYAHRVGYGLFCLSPKLSIDYSVFTRLFRLLGADFSHVGGIWGKSEASRLKTKGFVNMLRNEASIAAASLAPAWPVVTGISLENMGDYHSFYGDDTLFMDHIDIYSDVKHTTDKLQKLKEKLVKS